ncbi:MAG: PDDEXK nuclease domain-containing protein [Defluviitaleaceae bacterium]|nr:PDDEXK nuclease domain-containing protein [Defluviitaleaceae bacterium]
MSSEITPYANKIVTMIEQARQNALHSVNAEFIKLYWNVGEYLSVESAKSDWGDAFIDATAEYIKENCPGIKGFNRRGLYRMRQFYETYKENEFVSPLVTQISWTNHLVIMSGTKSIEENEFYIGLCIKEKYSKHELDFYLEALDREHKKPNENPSIGVILCASKEDEVVEFAMSRNLSPTMVADYSLKLIDKKLLEKKLREFKSILLAKDESRI